MTSQVSRMIENSYNRVKQWSTPKKILVGLALAPVVYFIASRSIAEAGSYWQRMQEDQRFQFEFNQNSQIEELDCKLDKIIGGEFNHFSEVPDHSLVHDAIHQYCDARALVEEDGSLESISKARELFKSAFEKGLIISQEILCQPNMFPDKENYSEFDLRFEHVCCLPFSNVCKCMPPNCPWEPRFENYTFYVSDVGRMYARPNSYLSQIHEEL